jgi:phytoene desaturase
MSDKKPHAVIIGSGFGGLAAAVRLGARGFRVSILERRDQPGGRAIVRHQDGFTFDMGPTIITVPYLFEDLWALCGRKFSDDIDLRPVTPFYRIRFNNGEYLDYSGDMQDMRRQIAKFSAADADGYERYMAMSERICKIGFEQLGHVPFGSWTDMARIAPVMARLQSYRSVYGMVSRYISDPRLRAAFSFHPLLIGGNPFSASSIYCMIAHLERHWGVHFAMGGTGRLVQGLLDLIRGQGGSLRLEAEVDQILVADGKACGVQLKSGEKIDADIVVSNADSAWTYRNLLPSGLRHRWTDRKLDRSRYSMSLFVWYFGTKKKYHDVPHHTIMLGPRYKEHLADIFDRKILADDFSLYLHRPSASDPSLAPPDHDAFYVLSPVPHLDADIDWSVMGERYRQVISQHLSDTVLPDLEANLVTSYMITPQYFHDDLNSYRGAAFGLEPVLTQSAWFRPHNKSEEVENLFLVGAGTHPGAGVPGVISSARVLDRIVPDASHYL